MFAVRIMFAVSRITYTLMIQHAITTLQYVKNTLN